MQRVDADIAPRRVLRDAAHQPNLRMLGGDIGDAAATVAAHPDDARSDDDAAAIVHPGQPVFTGEKRTAHMHRDHRVEGVLGIILDTRHHAGIAGVVAGVEDYPEDAFDAVIAVHVRGAFLACKYGLPRMNDGGSIVITSSIVGVRGDGGGSVAYVTAKHAQVGLMRSVSKNAARRNIRVNTLHPGPIDNEFQLNIEQGIGALTGLDGTALLNDAIPLHRHARAEEIARAALFLASDQSSFTTGSILMADGGMST